MHDRQSRRQSQRIDVNRVGMHERVGADVKRLCAAGDLFDRRRNILGTSEFRADDVETQRVSCCLHCLELWGDGWIGEVAGDREPA